MADAAGSNNRNFRQRRKISPPGRGMSSRILFRGKLNGLLAAKGFDLFAEELYKPYYTAGGKPSIPPGVYFRMPAISDSEEIDSQRGRHSRLVPPAGNSSHMKAFDIYTAMI